LIHQYTNYYLYIKYATFIINHIITWKYYYTYYILFYSNKKITKCKIQNPKPNVLGRHICIHRTWSVLRSCTAEATFLSVLLPASSVLPHILTLRPWSRTGLASLNTYVFVSRTNWTVFQTRPSMDLKERNKILFFILFIVLVFFVNAHWSMIRMCVYII